MVVQATYGRLRMFFQVLLHVLFSGQLWGDAHVCSHVSPSVCSGAVRRICMCFHLPDLPW
jgi:hypothetical protein